MALTLQGLTRWAWDIEQTEGRIAGATTAWARRRDAYDTEIKWPRGMHGVPRHPFCDRE
jgi:hypothetical protein